MQLEQHIEAVLFYRAEPVKKSKLAELFSVSLADVDSALQNIATAFTGRGIQLAVTDSEAQLVTAPEMSALIENIRKDELSSDIGKAGAETLAIILYRGPLSRIEIDRIRGVNSTFILRNLLIRGLIERRPHPTDQRSYTYAVTPSLLNHLGISSREALPEFAEMMNALDAFEREDAAQNEAQNHTETQ